MTELIVGSREQKFDTATPKLKANFQGVNIAEVTYMKFSANSYGTEACSWIADNVLKPAKKLTRVDFSDMFTARLRSDLPNSLRILMGALQPNNITSLNLSHNAFGPDGVKQFQDFLSQNSNLKVLDVTNCGLGPVGAKMIADAILKNPNMKLTEFYASRDRLEEEGMMAVAQVFEKQRSIVKLNLYQNGSKRGLPALFKALLSCKDTLRELHINDNKSVNRAIPELEQFILQSTNLQVLDISDLCIRKKYATVISAAIIKSLNSGSKLQHLKWNHDLSVSHTLATSFLNQVAAMPQRYLLTVEMLGVFCLRANRRRQRQQANLKNKVQLILFKPEYTDDESEDHDWSEEESQNEADQESQHSSQEEEEPQKKPAKGGLFGSSAPAAGGLFGSKPSQPPGSGAGLFGKPANPSGSLFGNPSAPSTTSANPSAPGLFGSKPAQPAKPPAKTFAPAPTQSSIPKLSTEGFGFGNTKLPFNGGGAPAPKTGGGLFGGGGFGSAPKEGSNLFGSKPVEGAKGGLFGGKPAAAEGLFGKPASKSPGADLFGSKPKEAEKPASGGLFGQKSASPGKNLFGGTTEKKNDAPKGGLFDLKPSNTGKTLFGSKPESESLPSFGNKNQAAPPKTSLFSTKSAAPMKAPEVKPEEKEKPKSMFGANFSQPAVANEQSSLFKEPAVVKKDTGSLFGAKVKNVSPSPFGAQKGTEANKPLFGAKGGATQSSTMFGQPKKENPAPQKSLFGATPATTGSLFGAKTTEKSSALPGVSEGLFNQQDPSKVTCERLETQINSSSTFAPKAVVRKSTKAAPPAPPPQQFKAVIKQKEYKPAKSPVVEMTTSQKQQIKEEEFANSRLLKEHQDDLDKYRAQLQLQNNQSKRKATDIMEEHINYYTDQKMQLQQNISNHFKEQISEYEVKQKVQMTEVLPGMIQSQYGYYNQKTAKQIHEETQIKIEAEMQRHTTTMVNPDRGMFKYQDIHFEELRKGRLLKSQADVLQRFNTATTKEQSEDLIKQFGECYLCHNPLRQLTSNDLASLDCGHLFHTRCIDEYRRKVQAQTGMVTFECPRCHVRSGIQQPLSKIKVPMPYVSDKLRDRELLNQAQLNDIAYNSSINALEGVHNTYMANKANLNVVIDHRVGQRVGELLDPQVTQSQLLNRKENLDSLMARANFDRDLLKKHKVKTMQKYQYIDPRLNEGVVTQRSEPSNQPNKRESKSLSAIEQKYQRNKALEAEQQKYIAKYEVANRNLTNQIQEQHKLIQEINSKLDHNNTPPEQLIPTVLVAAGAIFCASQLFLLDPFNVLSKTTQICVYLIIGMLAYFKVTGPQKS